MSANGQGSVDERRNEIDLPLPRAKKFQCRFLPEKVGFLYTDVINWKSLFLITTSRKGRKQLVSFSNVKRRVWRREFKWVRSSIVAFFFVVKNSDVVIDNTLTACLLF